MTNLRTVMPITRIISPKTPRHNSNPNCSPKHLCLSLFNSISTMRQLLQIHSYLLTSGLLFTDKFLVSETLRFCSLHPSGDLSHARALLLRCPTPMSSSWNHVIRGLCFNSFSADAVDVFLEMRRRQEATPNELTYPFVIKSCSELQDICVGRQVHADSIKNAVESVVYVGNTLMHLYGFFGEVHDARRMFDLMSQKTLISWNTILNVYVGSLMMEEAMEIFGKIIDSNLVLDHTTYLILLSAASLMGSLGLGMWVHSQIIYREIEACMKLGTALVHMYAKCGALDFASMKFERMVVKNVWTWTAMILGFAQHGCAHEALKLFKKMKKSSIEPNYVTFLGVLCACSHAGLVEDSHRFFHEMAHVHNIKPEMSHYSAMVDVLGRKGLLLQAYNFIKNMPLDPDAVVWRTLLNACQLHINGDGHSVGEAAMKVLLELEPNRCGNYVIVANMYSELGSWEEAAKVRRIMREEGLKKIAGESCIEISGSNYRFLSGYDFSIESKGIYQLIYGMNLNMKKIELADFDTFIQLQNLLFEN
ncbi:pentatricopeptide repeat-containing protein At2g36730 [Phalaenopsis equestris]|uniref:pentatricopeptide repeat-containing protein At2g36730 n=1 Tax=Phalaenopsis equestris TaxID=78828 RepID=UPI0009E45CA3|nr:pentatricopeptide repeat-containing protein At2g36730 [Phalaenopsis equestris]